MQTTKDIQTVQTEERKQVKATAKPKALKLTSRAKMGAARKAKAPAKVRKARGSRDDLMAAFVDQLMLEGMTIDQLFQRAAAELKKRGILRFTVRRKFDRFIASRERQSDKWKVVRKGNNIKMEAVQPKAAKPAPKNGQPTGRKVSKTTENGRQVVEAVAEQPETA